jgi:hypothetical protein
LTLLLVSTLLASAGVRSAHHRHRAPNAPAQLYHRLRAPGVWPSTVEPSVFPHKLFAKFAFSKATLIYTTRSGHALQAGHLRNNEPEK